MSEGIQIRHATLRSVLFVVEVPAKPFPEPMLCPTCRIPHPVKSVHLWLDDTGACVVSEGVLGELRLGGMPGLSVVGRIPNPPVLTINREVSRAEQDFRNRTQSDWTGRLSHG